MVHTGDLAYAFNQMKYTNVFFVVNLQSGVPRHFHWSFIAILIYNFTALMFMYMKDVPKI